MAAKIVVARDRELYRASADGASQKDRRRGRASVWPRLVARSRTIRFTLYPLQLNTSSL